MNLVLVCEGEEEIGSPHFGEIVRQPEVTAAAEEMRRRVHAGSRPGSGRQRRGDPGRQGSGRAGTGLQRREVGARAQARRSFQPRGPGRLPTWHLVQALNTLVEKDGHTPAVEGFFEKAKPLTPAQKKMIEARRCPTQRSHDEATARRGALGARQTWLDSLMRARLATHDQHRRPGGRLHRPRWQDRAAAPRGRQDRHAPGARHDRRGHARKLKAHLARTGFGDIEVNMSGGYDPNQTARQQAHPGAAGDLPETRSRIPCCGRARRAPGRATSSPTRR